MNWIILLKVLITIYCMVLLEVFFLASCQINPRPLAGQNHWQDECFVPYTQEELRLIMELEIGDESTLVNYGIRSGEWEAIVFGERFPEFWKIYGIHSILQVHDHVHRIDNCRVVDFMGEQLDWSGNRHAYNISPKRERGYITLMAKLTITSIHDLRGMVQEIELTRNGRRVLIKVDDAVRKEGR